MLTAFFESIKYVNHLIPLAFLRIYIGYFWFKQAILKYQAGLFTSQIFIDEYKTLDIISSYPSWYQSLFDNLIYPYWHIISPFIIGLEVFIGATLILGFLVRPASLLGILVCLHYAIEASGTVAMFYSTMSAIYFTMLIAGAGRCVGFDYYFFKRNRGIWW